MKNRKLLIIPIIILTFLFSTNIIQAQETQYGTGYLKDTVESKGNTFENSILGNTQTNTNGVAFQEIDLRDQFMPDIDNQGTTNSCVAYATARAVEYQVNKVFYKKYNTNGFKFNNVLSKKFLYYNARYTTYTDAELKDEGSSYKYTFSSLMTTGISIQSLHSDSLSVFIKPSYESMILANQYKINAFYTVETLQGIVNSLKLGLPVLIGTDVDAFSDARQTGFSAKSELWNSTTSIRANHAIVIVGLKNINNKWYFVLANSWGKEWGDGGYAYIDAQKMWDYNIEVAYVAILDKFASDLDTENPNYIQTQEIPCNTIIINNHAFDLDYANNPKNINEIQNAIVNADNYVFIKTARGELINNITGAKVTLNDMIAVIGSIIEFKDKNGAVSNIILKVQ